ncbi:hypothetical protein DRP53_00810 [candidate division WOR-3 bacterium]|uniref:Photosynthesis system II assembly factor Ycf48/Hcf136-like domain-containing protein n=1 Tax=candidate division WOR-3 bacterium TaxID=2052148 RepID=A0A660SLH9_UNCW3|nr:MAG: hypothetical protein DRP53_00810 [candidate division WOR-3 bacterium]
MTLIIFLATWELLTVPTEDDLLGLFFLDPQYGWVVGKNDLILFTSDGGESWEKQNSTTTNYDLYDVVFVDQNHGWICGWSPYSGFGVILGTTNGGRSWRLQAGTGQASYTEGIDFYDQNYGWAVGYDIFSSASQVLLTTDGGSAWQDYTLSFNSYLKGVDFIDPQRGYACGNYGMVLKSTDGGHSWNRISPGGGQTFYELKAFDTTNIIVAGDTMILTTDGGKTWQIRPIGRLRSLSFLTMARGWVCGEGGILTTRDSGQTWIPETTNTQLPLNSIVMLDSLHGFCVGDSGIVLRRTVPPAVGEEVITEGMKLPSGIYDLLGRRVVTMKQGIYFIVSDGKTTKIVRLR